VSDDFLGLLIAFTAGWLGVGREIQMTARVSSEKQEVIGSQGFEVVWVSADVSERPGIQQSLSSYNGGQKDVFGHGSFI
jgi:hypothetical protein